MFLWLWVKDKVDIVVITMIRLIEIIKEEELVWSLFIQSLMTW